MTRHGWRRVRSAVARRPWTLSAGQHATLTAVACIAGVAGVDLFVAHPPGIEALLAGAPVAASLTGRLRPTVVTGIGAVLAAIVLGVANGDLVSASHVVEVLTVIMAGILAALIAALATALRRAEGDDRMRALQSDRERVARELHHAVLERLFLASMSLCAMAEHPDTSPETAKRLLRTTAQIDTAIRESRRLLFAVGNGETEPAPAPSEARQQLDLFSEPPAQPAAAAAEVTQPEAGEEFAWPATAVAGGPGAAPAS